MTKVHDIYKPLALPDTPLEGCPVCASTAELWQFSQTEDGPTTKVVMCSNGEKIGPQDGSAHAGCPLYMPDDEHYRATIREAVKYWNEYAKALGSLQRANRWKTAQVLRGAEPVIGAQPFVKD